MLSSFRQRYPQGSLVSELVKIDRGIYIVKVSVRVNNIILATALAGADRVETAEDAARERAIAALALDSNQPATNSSSTNDIINTSPSTLSTPPQHPPAAFVPQKPVNNSNIVNFSEHQSEIPTQPTPASDVTPAPKLNLEPDGETVPPATNSGNLFDETFTGEILENPDSTPQHSVNNNLKSEISPVEVDIAPTTAESLAMDFNEIKHKTDIEIKRLGWTKEDGRKFLESRYGKRSRLHLSDEQLLEFLRYLEKLPTPVK